MVQQCCGQGCEGVDDQSRFDAAVEGGLCDDAQRPLPGCDDEPHYQVNGLQHWYGFYGPVEVLGEKVPEDLGPEEAFDCCCYLVWDSELVGFVKAVFAGDVQIAAVRTMRRAQWFLMSLPMVYYVYSSHCSPEPATLDLRDEFNRRNWRLRLQI